MSTLEIAHMRLLNQHVAGTPFEAPGEVVKWLGAVQAQDYLAAKWGVAARTKGVTDAAMERAFADGAVLRVHLLRPTWHFVAPEDIRWMLALTAPRVHAANAYWYRQAGLDNAIFSQSNAALERALRGGNQLTRLEIASRAPAGWYCYGYSPEIHLSNDASRIGWDCVQRGKAG